MKTIFIVIIALMVSGAITGATYFIKSEKASGCLVEEYSGWPFYYYKQITSDSDTCAEADTAITGFHIMNFIDDLFIFFVAAYTILILTSRRKGTAEPAKQIDGNN
ncbi:MAG: hypothetical protein V1838_02715 [Patescibacteria group bacterium]